MKPRYELDKKKILFASTILFFVFAFSILVIGLWYVISNAQNVQTAVSFGLNRFPLRWLVLFGLSSVATASLLSWNIAGLVWKHRMDIKLELYADELTEGRLSRLQERNMQLEIQLKNSRTESRGRKISRRRLMIIAEESVDRMLDKMKSEMREGEYE
jgi:hypothetical protein